MHTQQYLKSWKCSRCSKHAVVPSCVPFCHSRPFVRQCLCLQSEFRGGHKDRAFNRSKVEGILVQTAGLYRATLTLTQNTNTHSALTHWLFWQNSMVTGKTYRTLSGVVIFKIKTHFLWSLCYHCLIKDSSKQLLVDLKGRFRFITATYW